MCIGRHVKYRLLVCQSLMKLEFSRFLFFIITTIIMGTLREEQYTFLIISRSVLLRMRNISEKRCRENQNMFFVQ